MTAPDAPPEPHTTALDTPEAREALRRVLWDLGPIEADRDDIDALVPHALDALAPFVAAIQRAAFRAGVEAAAGWYDARAKEARQIGLDACAADELRDAAAIRVLPVPAAFAAPEPDGWRAMETAPRDGEPFLAALSSGRVVILYASGNLDAKARYRWWGGAGGPRVPVEDTHPPGTAFDERATHWRPLPTLPAVDMPEETAP